MMDNMTALSRVGGRFQKTTFGEWRDRDDTEVDLNAYRNMYGSSVRSAHTAIVPYVSVGMKDWSEFCPEDDKPT